MKSGNKLGLTIVTVLLLSAASYLIFKKLTDQSAASWHMINVNAGKLQGDAHLLLIGNTAVMIDAGYASEARKSVIPYLQDLGVKQIDHFFVSHPHRDHYEGLAVILDAGIEIQDCCYDKRDFLKFINYAKDRGSKLIQPQTGFKLSLPHESTLEILHAQEGNLPETRIDVNDLSLIMKWKIKGNSVLFPGDLNKKLGRVLSTDQRMQSDFLKMPHHGAASLAPNAFFNAVDPDYVLVPGPEGTWCGERGLRAREWTMSRKLPTWINGIHGHVKVEFKRDEAVISPEREDGKCKP
jgi:competence protein ComEC